MPRFTNHLRCGLEASPFMAGRKAHRKVLKVCVIVLIDDSRRYIRREEGSLTEPYAVYRNRSSHVGNPRPSGRGGGQLTLYLSSATIPPKAFSFSPPSCSELTITTSPLICLTNSISCSIFSLISPFKSSSKTSRVSIAP